MPLASIERDLNGLSRKLGISTDLMLLEHAWECEAGGLREYARIVALDNSALVLEADSAVVMQEISLRRRELLRKLNAYMPAPFLRQINVRISQRDGR